MKSKRIINILIYGLLFLTFLYGAGRYLGWVLFPRIWVDDTENVEDYATWYFSRTPRNTAEMVFVGSSHQYCSVDVNLLNREYGMNGILLTSSDQNMMLSYYAVMEAIEFQHPRYIVLEASMITGEHEPSVLAKTVFFDNMPNWSRTKAKGIRATGEPFYYYYYPVTALHDNWTEFQWKNLRFPPRLQNGERYSYTYHVVNPLNAWETVPAESRTALDEENLNWLRKMILLCRDNDVELFLYVSPYAADAGDQMAYNELAFFAGEEKIRYLNLMHCMEEIGLDTETDFMDRGHLNYSGQQKLTRFLAEWITVSDTNTEMEATEK